MDLDKLETAIAEAERFLKRAELLRANFPSRPWDKSTHRTAVRRSSMDLTRALADLRRR